MEIGIKISPELIAPAASAAGMNTGAIAIFNGVVRAEENGTVIGGLRYEAYQPMAETVIRDILTQLAVTSPCLTAFVQHRVGPVRVGETAIYVEIHAMHRTEAFALLAGFMDRLKQDVPIWKTDSLPC